MQGPDRCSYIHIRGYNYLHVCIHVCICICMHTYIYIYIHIYLCVNVCIRLFVNTYVALTFRSAMIVSGLGAIPAGLLFSTLDISKPQRLYLKAEARPRLHILYSLPTALPAPQSKRTKTPKREAPATIYTIITKTIQQPRHLPSQDQNSR